jgi:hypothetical protein
MRKCAIRFELSRICANLSHVISSCLNASVPSGYEECYVRTLCIATCLLDWSVAVRFMIWFEYST